MKIASLLLGFVLSTTAWAVDLSDEQVAYQKGTSSKNVLGKQWFDKVDISGTLAMAYALTDKDGNREHGSFNNNELIIWFTTQVWENVEANFEWYAVKQHFTTVGEGYIHFKNLLGGAFNLKVGRFDMPFGEEYLWQDSIDNPLVQRSAAWPWAWSEGVMVYGNAGSLGWIAAVSDGDLDTENIGDDDSPAKAINLKLYSQINDNFYVSASYLKNGRAYRSAFWIANDKWIGPELTRSCSSGSSTETTCDKTDFDAAELDFVFKMGDFFKLTTYAGMINTQDDYTATDYNRTFTYYLIQPQYYLTDEFYLAARYSVVESDKDGAALGSGVYFSNSKYTVKSYSQTQLGIGYQPNFNTRIVLEYGFNDWKYTDTDATDGRNFYGLRIATKF